MTPRAVPLLQPALGLTAAATLGVLGLWLLQATGLAVPLPLLPAQHHLPLHTLLESAGVLGAMLVFWIVWHAHRARRAAGLLALAGCALAGALLDLAHTLSFHGMPLFVTPAGRDKAALFWLAARLLMALGLLAASARWARYTPGARTRRSLLAALLTATTLLIGMTLWQPHWAGQVFDDGQRLLPAKIAAEGLLMLLFATAAWRLRHSTRAGDPGASWLLAAAALGVPGEAAMTLYGEVHDWFNFLGHAAKLAAIYCLYRGVLQATLRQPLQQLGELAAALQASANPMLITDADGRIRWVNQALCQAGGYAPAQLLGQPLAVLDASAGPCTAPCGHTHADIGTEIHVDADADAQVSAPQDLHAAMLAGQPWQGRLATRRHDGSHYLEQRTVTPIRNDGDEITGFISVGDDVTARSRADAEQRRLQRQLAQAQKMDALGQLTGGIAHDFNNMLSAVLGLATLARERHVTDPQGKLALYLGEIVKVAERGRELVARLMRFARPTHSGSPLAPSAQPLAPLVQEVLAMLRPALPAQIELDVQIAAELPPVCVEAVDLHQILTNLVLNARDAIDGAGRVQVELQAVAQPGADCSSCARRITGPQLALRVRDSGSGIPAPLLARVFEPFFTTKEVGRGTGLGLYMVHSLVHELGGHVRVHSSSAGTCIELLLPAAQPPASTSDPASAAIAPPTATPAPSAGKETFA